MNLIRTVLPVAQRCGCVPRSFVNKRSLSATASGEKMPMNLLARVRKVVYQDFPLGVKTLWNDFQTYQNINDASKTLVNSWRGKVPRRQLEHQRLFRADLSKVFPTIFLWIALPGVGNIYIVMAVFLFPKYSLSRQFLGKSERRKFLHQDYRAKQRLFPNVLKGGFGTVNNIAERIRKNQFYNLSCSKGSNRSMYLVDTVIDRLCKTEHITLNSLTRTQLVSLASATTSIPLPHVMPKMILKITLERHIQLIFDDDKLLIEEGDNLSDLIDDEIIAACELRALPTLQDMSIDHMKEVSQNQNFVVHDSLLKNLHPILSES